VIRCYSVDATRAHQALAGFLATESVPARDVIARAWLLLRALRTGHRSFSEIEEEAPRLYVLVDALDWVTSGVDCTPGERSRAFRWMKERRKVCYPCRGALP
jgi:hypothetical protein